MHQIIQPLPKILDFPQEPVASELGRSRELMSEGHQALTDSIASERRHILNALLQNAPLHPGIQERLGGVIAAAVSWPGGLFRYHLSRQMAQAFGASAVQSDTLACAVEFFHIASLLLDDLPQMDDSSQRRGRICPHLVYGEDMTILGALGLITRAYSLLGEVICGAQADRQGASHAFVEKCLGTSGILNGQARDLNFSNSKGGRREAIRVALGKTAPLIELGLTGPALFFGASQRTLTLLHRLSIFWGLIYQGGDDFKDLGQGESGKTPGRDQALGRPNVATLMGAKQATAYMTRLDRLAESCVEELRKENPQLHFLSSFQRLLQSRWEGLAGKR